MRISGLHNRRELHKKQEAASKLSGKVLKNFKGAGRIAVLLPDGSSHLIQSEQVVSTGETLYFEEADLLGEYQQPKKDSTDLQKDKQQTPSKLVSLFSGLQKESPLTPLLKELSTLLKKGEITPEVKQKVTAVLEQVKAEFPSLSTSVNATTVLDTLLHEQTDPFGGGIRDNEQQVSKAFSKLESKLVSLLVENIAQNGGEKIGSERKATIVKALVESAIKSNLIKIDLDKSKLFSKLTPKDMQQNILPQLAQSQPKLQPLIAMISSVKDTPDLFIMPQTETFQTVSGNVGNIESQLGSQPNNVQYMPKLLQSDFAFTSLFSTVSKEYPSFQKVTPVETSVDTLMAGTEVDSKSLKIVHGEVSNILKSDAFSKEQIGEALQKTLLYISSQSGKNTPLFPKEVFHFHLHGGKEMPQQVATLKESVQQLIELPNVALTAEQKDSFHSLVTTLSNKEQLLTEPAMSNIIKKEGLTALLTRLGVVPLTDSGTVSHRTLSLKQVAESILEKVQLLEQQITSESEDESSEELETLKKLLSTLKEKGRETLKTLSTLSVLAKPIEKGAVAEQTLFFPVQIGGEEVTVHLKVRRDKDSKKGSSAAIDGTQVEIAMELKKLGHIESRLQLTKNKKLSVALTSGKSSVVQWFRDNLREMYTALEDTNLTSVSLIIDGVKPFQERSKAVKKSRIEFTG